MIRNRYMVALSSRIIAVYDGREKGGTFFTIRYAHAMEKSEIISLCIFIRVFNKSLSALPISRFQPLDGFFLVITGNGLISPIGVPARLLRF